MCFTSCVGLFAFRGCLSYHFLRWQGKARHAVRKPDASFSIGATFCPRVLPALLLAAADVVFRFVSSFVFLLTFLSSVLCLGLCFDLFCFSPLRTSPPYLPITTFCFVCFDSCVYVCALFCFRSDFSFRPFRLLAATWSDQCYVHRGTQGVTSQAARPPVIM